MLVTLVMYVAIYFGLTLLGNQFLSSMSVVLYLALIYLLPPLLNVLGITLRKNKTEKLSLSLILPLFSTLFYAALSWVTEKSGSWQAFVNHNTVSNQNLTVEIEANGFDPSQIIFMVLVYFGISLTAYYLSTKKDKKQRGKQYA